MEALRRRGLDVLTTADAGRDGVADEEQLIFAAHEGRAVFTANVADFARIHARWMNQGRSHAGIIYWVRKDQPVAAVIRGLTELATALSPDDIASQAVWLRRWM